MSYDCREESFLGELRLPTVFFPEGICQVWMQTKNGALPRSMISNEWKEKTAEVGEPQGWAGCTGTQCSLRNLS